MLDVFLQHAIVIQIHIANPVCGDDLLCQQLIKINLIAADSQWEVTYALEPRSRKELIY